jgi:hypothetical protein
MSTISTFKEKLAEWKESKVFLRSLEEEILGEAASKKPRAKISSNTKGVLHELLVGMHLNGGKHMERHRNEEGESPKQAHDRLKATIHSEDYSKISKRAKSAAAHIREHAESSGRKVSKVHWTSKHGDIERSTGIKSSQKEDPSDIVIHTHHPEKGVHYAGVSLKVSEKSSKNVPGSNLGASSMGPGAHKAIESHRKSLLSKHKKLKSLSNKKSRKEWLASSNASVHKDIKTKSLSVLAKIAKDTATHLQKSSPEKLESHIRDVLGAKQTPMQQKGHTHIKHTTYGEKTTKHHISNPGTDHDHIFRDHKHITVHHNGTGISFKYKGKTFAKQRMKFDSQSDPMSTVKSTGKAVG